MMKTNIVIDDKLMADTLRATGLRTKREVVELGDTKAPAIGDLVLTEVLQGFMVDHEFNETRRLFAGLKLVELGGENVAIEASRNFRKLGITVRQTIDTVIATRCIVSGYELLHDDRDFDAFEKHLGLRCVISGA